MENWLLYGNNCQTVACCAGVNLAREYSNHFNNNGIPSAVIYSELASTERKAIIQDFKDKKIRIIFQYSILIEGIDIPSIGCLLMLRPTKSEIVFGQSLGRGLRLEKGKKELIYLEFTKNIIDFFDFYSKTNWNIKAEEKQPKPITCKKCKHQFTIIPELLSIKFNNGNRIIIAICPNCLNEIHLSSTKIDREYERNLESKEEKQILRELTFKQLATCKVEYEFNIYTKNIFTGRWTVYQSPFYKDKLQPKQIYYQLKRHYIPMFLSEEDWLNLVDKHNFCRGWGKYTYQNLKADLITNDDLTQNLLQTTITGENNR